MAETGKTIVNATFEQPNVVKTATFCVYVTIDLNGYDTLKTSFHMFVVQVHYQQNTK